MERLRFSGMEVEAYVQGEGRALLFLHGEDYFQQHRPFLDALARKWRVIAPRHPGFGSTPLPPHFMKVDDLAYFYLDLLDQMKLEHPLVVGASFGGWIALELAVRVPERIDGLALLGTYGVKLGGRYERDFADIFQAPESEVRKLTFAGPKWVPDYFGMSDAELQSMARDRQSAAHFGWRPYMHNPTLRHWLHRVRMPTLVVTGDNDGIVAPGYARSLAEALPNAILETVENAGHYPQIERCEDVVSALARFAA